MHAGLGKLVLLLLLAAASGHAQQTSGQWLWVANPPSTTNVFHYFRTTFAKPTTTNAYIRVAADSNAAVFLNGALLTRKVTRYREQNITADIVPLPAANLTSGTNVLVIRHHSWGNIVCFQRTGQLQPGLYVDSNFGLQSSTSSFKVILAPEHMVHSEQILGITGTPRIRFPQIVDGRLRLPGDIHSPSYDDSGWQTPIVVTNGPWPAVPPSTETTVAGRFQGGDIEVPYKILAAGMVNTAPYSSDPYSIQDAIRGATYLLNAGLTQSLQQNLTAGQPMVLTGAAGSAAYITFDFGNPKHGYPRVDFGASQSAGLIMDMAYTEKPFDLYTGSVFVNTSGWIDPFGIVGKGYADRYITIDGDQSIELPDERTLRWWTVHFRFNGSATSAHITRAAVQSWTFDIRHTQAYFTSGDPVLDRITRLSLTFAKMGMSDTFVDTPGREDGQWIEDARIRAVIAASWFNDTSLRKVMIRQQAEMQQPDGSMHPFPPSNYPASASSDWSLQWVATMYDDFAYTRSTERVQRFWPQLVTYWNAQLKMLRSDGMWTGNCLNDIRVTPGCKSGASACASGIVTPWLIERLEFSVAMALAINQTAQAQQWQQAAQQVRQAFPNFIVPASGNTPAYIGAMAGYDSKSNQWEPVGFLQASHTVAVFTDLVNASFARSVLDYAFPASGVPPAGVQRWNNPTFLRRALKALSHVNMTQRAIGHLKERFNQYLPNTTQTPIPVPLQGIDGGPLPEYWVSRVDEGLKPGQNDDAQPADGTGSHGWTCVALEWMHTYLLGVREQWANRTVLVQPDDGGVLPQCTGATYTSWGLLQSDWRPSTGSWTVVAPAAPTLIYQAPSSCRGKLQLVQQPSGGKIISQTSSQLVVSGAGTWSMKC